MVRFRSDVFIKGRSRWGTWLSEHEYFCMKKPFLLSCVENKPSSWTWAFGALRVGEDLLHQRNLQIGKHHQFPLPGRAQHVLKYNEIPRKTNPQKWVYAWIQITVYIYMHIYIYLLYRINTYIPTVQYMLYPPPEAILDSGPGVVWKKS